MFGRMWQIFKLNYTQVNFFKKNKVPPNTIFL